MRTEKRQLLASKWYQAQIVFNLLNIWCMLLLSGVMYFIGKVFTICLYSVHNLCKITFLMQQIPKNVRQYCKSCPLLCDENFLSLGELRMFILCGFLVILFLSRIFVFFSNLLIFISHYWLWYVAYLIVDICQFDFAFLALTTVFPLKFWEIMCRLVLCFLSI